MKGLIKEELVDGELYKHKDGAIVVYQVGRNGFGFNELENYYNGDGWSFGSDPQNWTPATKEYKKKFKALLIKESIKKGLVSGATVMKPQFGESTLYGTDYEFSMGNKDVELMLGGDFVFLNGVWATMPEMEAMNDSVTNLCDEVKDFTKLMNKKAPTRNVNNASHNAVKEYTLDFALKSMATNTHHTLSEIKEMYRMVEDVDKLSRIIEVANSLSMNPLKVITILKEFKV